MNDVLMYVIADSMGRPNFAQTLGPGVYIGCGLCQFQISFDACAKLSTVWLSAAPEQHAVHLPVTGA
jgi:hypothetical protein